MIDILNEITAIGRSVDRRGEGDGETVAVTLTRTYEATAAELWSALTEPERLERRFLPITGDLREGGSFQLVGNAGGEILRCQAPELLRVSFGGPDSIVELRLAENNAGVELVLEHTVPIAMAGSGAGALYVGPGWDGALLGVGLYLAGQAIGDPVAAANSPEGLAFSAASIEAWLDVLRSSGTATDAEIADADAASRAQFTPEVH